MKTKISTVLEFLYYRNLIDVRVIINGVLIGIISAFILWAVSSNFSRAIEYSIDPAQPTITVTSVNQQGGITAGIINQLAKFQVVSTIVNEKQVSITVQANGDLLPLNVCVRTVTDGEIIYVMSSMPVTSRSGDKQNYMCFTDPTKTFVLTYTINSKPSFFEASVSD